jgi:hypothetical protein
MEHMKNMGSDLSRVLAKSSKQRGENGLANVWIVHGENTQEPAREQGNEHTVTV